MKPKFYPGEIVSVPSMNVSGRVIEKRRRSDGEPFLMIEVLDGPHKGSREYVTSEWYLGYGTHETPCERCARPFRFKPPHADNLPWCDRCRGTDQNRDPGRRSSSWELSDGRRARSKSK